MAISDIEKDDAYSVKQANEEEGQEKKTFDQTILMQNLPFLTNEYLSPFGKLNAKIVKLTDTKDEDIGCDINLIYKFEDFIKSFNNLNSADLSNLVPYIELYKIYPETGIKRQFNFNNYFPRKAIDSITGTGSDRGFQANLKNLQLDSQGKDPATMYQYLVKMKFTFDSIQALFDENNKYTELFTAAKELKGLRGNADPKYYKILLKFGWNVNNNFPGNLNIHEKDLQSFVDGSHGELYINYIKHTLNIQEDGSVELDVEYIGTLESEARNPHIINIIEPSTVEEIKRLDQIISDTEETLRKRYGEGLEIVKEYDDKTNQIKKIELKLPDLDATFGDTKDITDKEQDLVALLQSSIDKKNNLEKTSRESFITKILDNLQKMYIDPNKNIRGGGTIPFFRILRKEYEERKKYIELFKQEIINSKFQQNTLKNIINNSFVMPAPGVSPYEAYPNAFLTKKDPLNTRDYYEYLFLQEPLDDYRLVRYFTFGTLLKALRLNKSFLIVGCDVPISSFDFTKSSTQLNSGIVGSDLNSSIFSQPDFKKYKDIDIKNSNSSFVYEYKIKQTNILDLPISMSTFKHWFTNHIMSSDRYYMSLISFLNSCVNDLLPSVVQPTTDDYYPTQNLKFKYHMDRVSISKENPLYKEARKNESGELTKIPSFSVKKQSTPFDFIKDIRSTDVENKIEVNFIMLYAVPKYFQRKRDITKDFQTGIPSFYYGNKNSVINKIVFKENTIPYLKEAAIQKQVEGTKWRPGVFLRGLYNVSLECMGVTYFRPGTIFYVSPSFTGVKDLSDPISLGIGGYFMLVSIKLVIEAGKFITSLEGIWVSTGDGMITDLSGAPLKIFRTSPLPQSTQAPGSIETEGVFSAN
jgi:hypothetical protein